MLTKEIIFEPSVSYYQEENGIAKQKGQTLMECIRCTIIRGRISDNLWPKIFLIITHISNLLSIFFFNYQSPFEASLNTFQTYNIYVFFAQQFTFLYTKKNERQH